MDRQFISETKQKGEDNRKPIEVNKEQDVYAEVREANEEDEGESSEDNGNRNIDHKYKEQSANATLNCRIKRYYKSKKIKQRQRSYWQQFC